MLGSRIAGVGKFVPPKVVTNKDLEEMMDTSDEWIRQRTGIETRYWVEPGVGTSDLALEASRIAMERAGVSKDDLDMIIFATLSPDYDFPGSGCILQAKLDVPGIPAIDIRQQCSGFVYGLSMADLYIRSGQYKTVLVVGAEIQSKGLFRSPEGRDTGVLFGDGAGAVVVTQTEVTDPNKDSHMIGFDMHSDGRFAKELWIAAPGTAFEFENRVDQKMLDQKLHQPYMNGRLVFSHAVRSMAETLTTTLKKANTKLEDVDLFLFHQANLRINSKVAEVMNIPEDKVFNTVQKYGNTTAATIPIGMNDAFEEGKLKPGMLVGMAAFGSGFTWASGLMRF